MVKVVDHEGKGSHGDHAGRDALRRFFSLGLFGLLSVVSVSSAALSIGSYRCASSNTGGAGGYCRSAPPIEIRAGGSYRESSTSGRYTVKGDQILFSASTIRGPGQLVDDSTIRFQYTYKGLANTVTYHCFNCSNAPAPGPAQRANSAAAKRVGVTLYIAFAEAISGATSFAMVPREQASRFGHQSALPAGAVTGLVVDVSRSQVRLATNRDNPLAVDQDYVVFLVYPAETVAVAAFHLPAVKSDFEGYLQGGIYRNGLPQAAYSAPSPADGLVPGDGPPPSAGEFGMESGAGPEAPPPPAPTAGSPYSLGQEPPVAYPAPPGTYPAPPPSPYPASPSYPSPTAAVPAKAAAPAKARPAKSLQGFTRALKTIENVVNALGSEQGQTPPADTSPGSYPASAPGAYPAPAANGYPAPTPGAYPGNSPASSGYPAPSVMSAPKCNPNIPKYSQAGCVE